MIITARNSDEIYDGIAATIVLGCLLKKPALLEQNEKYNFTVDDFVGKLHKIVYIAISSLQKNGLEDIRYIDIQDYLNRTSQLEGKFFDNSDGATFLTHCLNQADTDGKRIDYYYDRIKKLSLLRHFAESGVNVYDVYDPSTTDIIQEDKQNKYLEEHSIDEIIEEINKKFGNVNEKFHFEGMRSADFAGKNIEDFMKYIEVTPAIGVPFFGKIFTGACAGARLKKYYIVNSPTGTGKSRLLISQACYIACGEYYDKLTLEWVKTGIKRPSLYISTELDQNEIIAMMIANISGVNEEVVLGKRPKNFDETERINRAVEIIKNSPLYYEVIPDFTLDDIENIIKLNVDKYHIQYVFYDYIHTSLSMLAAIGQKAGRVSMREDQILFMFSDRLKTLCNKYDIFIFTATQTNRSVSSGASDSSIVRGSSAILDKADLGFVMMNLTDDDKEGFKKMKTSGKLKTNLTPNRVMNVYKNRGNAFMGKIFLFADLSTSQFHDICASTNDYEMLELPDYTEEYRKANNVTG